MKSMRLTALSNKKVCVGALLLASGVLLPQLFHIIGGKSAGGIFLPMHIPVFLSGILLGPFYGAIIGILSPLFSFMLTGMPVAVKLPFMILELFTYGLVSGLLKSKQKNIYLNLIISQILGRLVNCVAIVIAVYMLKFDIPGLGAAGAAFVTGIPGILLQLLLIPFIYKTVRRRSMNFDK